MNRRNLATRKNLAISEFKSVVETYLLPLFDVKGELELHLKPTKNTQLVTITSQNNTVSTVNFYPCIPPKNKLSPFYFSIQILPSFALKKPANEILRELIKVTEYNCMDFSKQRDYGKGIARELTYKTRTLDLAFELGICKWLTHRDQDAAILHTLICRMIDWASKTYEGKKVPFGIVIDFSKCAKDDAADYLHFLENDSSAVFTDGIFSGILLDHKGKVVSFLTNESGASLPVDELREVFAPFQFKSIAKLCVGSAIGVIALTNGEIIIIKDQSICFAKRGSKWISFDWGRVYTKLRPYFMLSENATEVNTKKKIQKLYCTILDVSFAHTGGCIAFVIPDKEKNINDAIKERLDLCVAGSPPDTISLESREKISILTCLLAQSPHHLHSFFELEKPLRKEILGLDGATVISLDGDFYCVGSIVAVSGGSSGGGRTAAMNKLSNYGIGIKISEDGYIEAKGIDLKESSDVIPLFKFK